MAEQLALLIDYEYCVGCCDCELACMNEHGFGPERLGIKVQKLGPLTSPMGRWQYDFIPIPTDWCDLCERRLAAGGRPACQDECTYSAIKAYSLSRAQDCASIKGKALIFVK